MISMDSRLVIIYLTACFSMVQCLQDTILLEILFLPKTSCCILIWVPHLWWLHDLGKTFGGDVSGEVQQDTGIFIEDHLFVLVHLVKWSRLTLGSPLIVKCIEFVHFVEIGRLLEIHWRCVGYCEGWEEVPTLFVLLFVHWLIPSHWWRLLTIVML